MFLGGVTTVNDAAPTANRAEVLSGFYVIVHLGVGLPVLGVGVLATTVSLPTAVSWSAGTAAVLCLLVLLALGRTIRRAQLKRTAPRP